MIKSLKVIALGFSVCISLNLSAQERAVTVTYKTNPDKTVDFSYEKSDIGSYTVILNFKTYENTHITDKEYTIKNYSGNLVTLTPINKEQSINFSYGYSSIRGKLNPKWNPDFVYLLPVKEGIKVKVVESGFLSAKYFGNTTPDDWKVYRFYTPDEATVTAIRKGIVVDIKENAIDKENSPELTYTSQTNDITVEHPDGTLAVYKGLKKGSIVVKPDQTVVPGSTLGINSRLNTKSQYGITLSIIYLKSTDLESKRSQNLTNSKSLYGFVTPYFLTAENAKHILVAQKEYTSVTTPEIIQQELSKKELKQLAKK